MVGVSNLEEQSIRNSLGIVQGSFPFKYLRVPFTTRKLKYIDCKPLIDKTVARVRTWSTKIISYARTLQLARSVLIGMQLYWCQIFVMPKEGYERNSQYLQNFSVDGRRHRE